MKSKLLNMIVIAIHITFSLLVVVPANNDTQRFT